MTGFIMYEESFKLRVVREVLSGELTQKEANQRYGIRGHSTILKWIRKFEEHKSFSLNMTPIKKSESQDLQKRLKQLEYQLENERLRSEGLSRMIDIAEEELKITIRKKSNTKQSKQ
jgi:transposase